jgi:hypothetical protein
MGSTSYGSIPNYLEHFSEHYVDMGTGSATGYPTTDAILSSAYNFDITHWSPVTSQEKEGLTQFFTGHQWPRWWYEESVTAPNEFKPYGFPLSFEGGNSGFNTLGQTAYLAGGCIQLTGTGAMTTCPEHPP